MTMRPLADPSFGCAADPNTDTKLDCCDLAGPDIFKNQTLEVVLPKAKGRIDNDPAFQTLQF